MMTESQTTDCHEQSELCSLTFSVEYPRWIRKKERKLRIVERWVIRAPNTTVRYYMIYIFIIDP